MKSLKKVIAVLSLIVMITGFASAQTGAKFGYIDSNEILAMMPETDSLQNELKAYADYLDEQMSTMAMEYQTKVTDYQENYNTMSDLIRQTKEKEITDLQARIQAFQQSADQDLGAKQAELFNPLIDKVKVAITEVARENGYNYIFDVGTGALVFYETGDNIIPLVKTKLGIQ
ncbi:MAG: OmpH family outer membrane protein [Lentimicrobiaceae bacterium]|jgi:outer membrane protein|nr:OmpH family outer membrane protein [Lentimicrobiaceae bacterium]MBT3454899.1 OmpH family outer membrane protein [Lentimicrobiaceae bacterium]MBT3818475.1 OmpH family outer membrane protein [Lentimicrobiaceae bacterium]MBT4060843.1 OmpH family outer membrane protein [Lentimicrobiaceae bacterium]MBT4190516.1 OmpH family outer membrane protein [Lentimicrobiaceae bacterium]